MTELWYQNPEILLNNLDQFIPNNKLSKVENLNSIARFSIYLAIILLILKQDNKWLIISLLLLFISYYLSLPTKLNFIKTTPKQPTIEPDSRSTFDNPYMNYITNNTTENNTNSFPPILPNNLSLNSDINTNLNLFIKNESFNISTTPLSQPIQPSAPKILANLSSTPDILGSIPLTSNSNTINEADIQNIEDKTISVNNTINYDLCITSNNKKSCLPDNKIIEDPDNLPNKFKINKDLKKQIRKNYRSHLQFDSIDMWGALITDRNYYTSPNIELVNDQTGFAQWCYTNNGGSGKCKTDGSNCVKDRDVRYNRGRISNN